MFAGANEKAIKEFSQSRLHFQALQEKQRMNTRRRLRRPPTSSPKPPGDGGKRKAGEKGHANEAAGDDGLPRSSEDGSDETVQIKDEQGDDDADAEADEGGDDGRDDDDDDEIGGKAGPWGGTKTVEEDPLGLIRREIAVMKKLE